MSDLENEVKELKARIVELELTVYGVDVEDALDPLEAAHQMFVMSIRSEREGNA